MAAVWGASASDPRKLVINKTKARGTLEGGALRPRARGARPSIVRRCTLPDVRIRISFALVSLGVPLTNVRATPQDEQLPQIARAYIEAYLVFHPETATDVGDH